MWSLKEYWCCAVCRWKDVMENSAAGTTTTGRVTRGIWFDTVSAMLSLFAANMCQCFATWYSIAWEEVLSTVAGHLWCPFWIYGSFGYVNVSFDYTCMYYVPVYYLLVFLWFDVSADEDGLMCSVLYCVMCWLCSSFFIKKKYQILV